MPNVPYPYEVNVKLVTRSGSLTPMCSLSNSSLSPSLTVYISKQTVETCLNGPINQYGKDPTRAELLCMCKFGNFWFSTYIEVFDVFAYQICLVIEV